MQIIETSAEEYGRLFTNFPHVYNSVEFSELNRYKVENLHYLVFKDTKARFGLVLGERNDGLYSPFSAPFGGFTTNKYQRFDIIDDAVNTLLQYSKERGKRIVITLPPPFYDEWRLACYANSLSRVAKKTSFEVNYHFLLSDFANYEAVMKRPGNSTLRQAMKGGLYFQKIEKDDISGISRAYEVTRQNKAERGYPLRMSYEAIINTIKIIPADFFLVTYNNIDIAAAHVFRPCPGIYQPILWGDIREFAHLRPMNFLAYNLFKYYYMQGVEIFDLGPSTEFTIPNYGLCSFKESIGCRSSLKLTFEL